MKPSQKKVIVTGFVSLLQAEYNHFEAIPMVCHGYVLSGYRIIGVVLPMVPELAISKLAFIVRRHDPGIIIDIQLRLESKKVIIDCCVFNERVFQEQHQSPQIVSLSNMEYTIVENATDILYPRPSLVRYATDMGMRHTAKVYRYTLLLQKPPRLQEGKHII